MRPPCRRLSKRGLVLPTIREGAEESLRDLHEAKALHASSEDYLLSICHLASPTFPSGHTSPDSIRPLQLQASRPGDSTPEAHEIRLNGGDPLEHLYGRQKAPSGGARGAFVPRASIAPDLRRQRESCSRPESRGSADASVPSRGFSRSESAEGGQRRGAAGKPSLIGRWLSDCRSAWRRARGRACVLPAIAEL